MNKVIAWVKTNWAIVVLTVVILVSLPAGLLVSSSLNQGLRDDMEKKVAADWADVNKDKFSYSIPSPAAPNVQLLDYTDVPNAEYIKWFAAQREAVKDSASKVWLKALEFNKDSHTLLVDGLFPKPSQSDEGFKQNQFAKALIERVEPMLLDKIKAGAPPDHDKLLARLKERLDRLRAQQPGNPSDQLPPQAAAKMLEDLVATRRSEYIKRAGEIQVYADASAFTAFPAKVPTAPPTVRQCWEYQEAVWVYEDLMRAIAAANESTEGVSPGATGVAASIIKRIYNVSVEPGPGTNVGENPGARGDGLTGLVTTDFNASLTGRVCGLGSNNQLYDVKYARLDMIVSSRRLPQFLDALTRTNFLTVIDCDLFGSIPGNTNFDLNQHMDDGYYYGEEHVVRANIYVEAILFRDWTKDLMPADIKTDRDVKADRVADVGKAPEPAAPAPASAPRPAPSTTPPKPPENRPGGGRRPSGVDDLPG